MITVIGLDGSPLTAEAVAAIERATLVVGGERHLRGVPTRPWASTMVLGELAPALDALAGHPADAAVLASGDPGFFGILRALHRRGLECTVLPAVSSVALAFSRAGLPWDDAMAVSAHGRDLRQAVNVCRAYPQVAVLTGPAAGPAEIGAALAGWRRQLIVCEHLGSDRERITGCTPAAARRQTWEDPNVVLVLAPGARPGDGPGWVWPHLPPAVPPRGDNPPQPPVVGWALGEDAFDTRDAVITKPEVRALALARLAPAPGTLVWDVGAGAGSVAVECARFGAAVVAVERDARRCARVRGNARRHGVDVRVVNGAAPTALAGLPEPDAVFVGGGGDAVVAAVAERGPARIVVALAAVERAGPVRATLAGAGYTVDGVLLQAARFAPLPGGVHRLASTNPTFLLWAAPPPPGPRDAGGTAAR